MAWQDWNGRTAWYFVKLTPGYPLLYGALGIGLLVALALILFVGHTAKTEGFGCSLTNWPASKACRRWRPG
jgi:uncharacterized membrane protein